MTNIEAAMDRIKKLECPTGELTDRVAGILVDYQVANVNAIVITRANALDKDGAQAYRVIFADDDKGLVFQAVSGADDYVAAITEVKIS